MKKIFSRTLIVGFILGIIFWGGFNWSLKVSNTEEFCISCHEMEDNAFVEYQDTIHYKNRTGVRATCPDCHVPKEWKYKIVRKIKATTELYHTFMGTVDSKEKYDSHRLDMAMRVWRSMKETGSRECRNCHEYASMDMEEQGKSARRKHVKAIDADGTCIDCHKGIAHELPDDWKAAAKAEGL